jgi:hypothetical protein
MLPPLLVLAACGGNEPPLTSPGASFAPLAYDYLTPIRLNVSAIEVEQRFVPQPDDLGRFSPTPPVEALQQMARGRLGAFGANGRAVFVIRNASLTRAGDSYFGDFGVELDLYTGGARAGFAEARVTRSRTIDRDTPRDAALYTLTKDLMDQMNVEFEYQVRRSLRDWIVAVPEAAPPPVEQQQLAPPPGERQDVFPPPS